MTTAPRGHLFLRVAEYGVRLRFTGAGRLSAHPGVTLRGGFGKALRDISCVYPKRPCEACPAGTRCAYGYLFESPVTGEAGIMRRYTHAPHPFVLRAPWEHGGHVEAGTEMNVALVLVGRGCDYFPLALLGLMRLGELGLGPERAAFEVQQVRSEAGGAVVYEAGRQGPVTPPAPTPHTVRPGPARAGRFGIRLVSPLRLRVEDRVLRAPDFAALISASLRRLELLARVHDEGDVNIAAADLVKQAHTTRLVADATRWRDVFRYSGRQGRSMPLGGLVGEAVFEGDIGTFGDVLDLAGRVHVGKGTAFGHGHFQVEEEGADGGAS